MRSIEVPEIGRLYADAAFTTHDAAAGITTPTPPTTVTLSAALTVTSTIFVPNEPTSTVRGEKGISLETLTVALGPTMSCFPTCKGEIPMSFVEESTISGKNSEVLVFTVPEGTSTTALLEGTSTVTNTILPEITIPPYTPTTFRFETPIVTLVEGTASDGHRAEVVTTIELGVTEVTVSGADTTWADVVEFTMSEEPTTMNTMDLVESKA